MLTLLRISQTVASQTNSPPRKEPLVWTQTGPSWRGHLPQLNFHKQPGEKKSTRTHIYTHYTLRTHRANAKLSPLACRRWRHVTGQSWKRRKQKQHGDGWEKKERELQKNFQKGFVKSLFFVSRVLERCLQRCGGLHGSQSAQSWLVLPLVGW